MGTTRPIPTKKFEKWLKSKGLVLIRIRASHHIWNRPNNPLTRPVIFQGAAKEVPYFILKNDSELLGIDYQTFLKELEDL